MVNRSSQSGNLQLQSPVYVGDELITGKHARLHLSMRDNTQLTLGENTQFSINHYTYTAEQHGGADLELVRGVFRAVTGLIGKLNPAGFSVTTPAATIGIRGTDFWGGYHFSDALDVALLNGKGIDIENAQGKVAINQPNYGSTIAHANARPSPPKQWGTQKLNAARESVSFNP